MENVYNTIGIHPDAQKMLENACNIRTIENLERQFTKLKAKKLQGIRNNAQRDLYLFVSTLTLSLVPPAWSPTIGAEQMATPACPTYSQIE